VWPPYADTVRQAIAGDSRALTELLTLGHPRIVAFFLGLGLDLHSADDLAAETAEAIVKGISRLREPQAFEAWFWSIARNRLRNFYRRRRSARPTDAMISPATPEELSIEREEHRRILAALAQLSPRDRELLWLREVEGLEYEEIGGRLGTAIGTVRVAIHRARRRLEEIYQRDEVDRSHPRP
jgi:RNA polymerase sigma-70 factor (ECF subfamily)